MHRDPLADQPPARDNRLGSGRAGDYARALAFAERQIRGLTQRAPDFLPMYTSGGCWRHKGEQWTDWCGGFLAGITWLLHRHTGQRSWGQQAQHYSRLLEPRKDDRHVHDLGFIFLNSYARWHAVSLDDRLMDVVAHAGVTLSRRFQPKGRYLASFLGPGSLFIDIMMNVPIVFVAADWLEARLRTTHHAPRTAHASTHNSPLTTHASPTELRSVALAHCLTSQQYLVRPDGTTAHEALFDTTTGEFLRESTQQGLRPDSCWSRGLAWALYGFGSVYRLTRDGQFLQTARRCADYFLAHLPPERVPYWDFHAPPGPGRLWDSSAAAIAAAGLLQLAELSPGSVSLPPLPPGEGRGEGSATATPNDSDSPTTRDRAGAASSHYRAAALDILDALCSDEFLAAATPGWEGILRHAVYHYHKKLGVDESVMWGDHYFVEAVVKALEFMEGE